MQPPISTSGYINIWKWRNGTWAVYLPGAQDGGQTYAESMGYSPLQTNMPGQGFWVNSLGELSVP